jgi:hypothetical protein
VTEDMELVRLLRLLGLVEPPSPEVLDGARERLWPAVAGEMLGTSDEAGRGAGRDRERPSRRRRAEPGS